MSLAPTSSVLALLICPSHKWAASALWPVPPALVPLLGRTALDRALSRLYSAGAREVLVLAADRPDEIRAILEEGTPWGLKAQLLPQRCDLTPEEARIKYAKADEVWLHQTDAEMLVMPWASPQLWFSNLIGLMAACAVDTVTMREVSTGVWVSSHAHVSNEATLIAPCWVGSHATVGPKAIVGPEAVIETNAVIESNAEVAYSHVGPGTFVAPGLSLLHSAAWGRLLMDLRTGYSTRLRDGLLLDNLAATEGAKHGHLVGRFTAGLALILTWPVLLAAWILSAIKGKPMLVKQQAVRAPLMGGVADAETLDWYQLDAFEGWLRRWPELVQVWRGQFVWMSNRPLTLQQAEGLNEECDRLWLALPPGIFSFGESLGCDDLNTDEARAHAAYYSVTRTLGCDLRALLRVLKRLWGKPPHFPQPNGFSFSPILTPKPHAPAIKL